MTLLVAEVGINHNGDFERLMALIDMALKNGADLVKMQVKTPELCVPENEWDKPKKWFDGTPMTYIEYKRKMEFTETQLYHVKKTFGDKVFASVWDKDSIRKYLQIFGSHLVKIPSAKIVKKELMIDAYNMFDNVIWSTGMSTERMVRSAIEWLSLASSRPETVTILDCHSAYPTPESEVNLSRFIYVKKLVDGWYDTGYIPDYHHRVNMSVGYSSHARTISPCLYAAALGATMIEVHFTDDNNMPGTDQLASLDVRSFFTLANQLKTVKMYLDHEPGIFIRDSEMPSLRKLR